jgi:hypothetical protein
MLPRVGRLLPVETVVRPGGATLVLHKCSACGTSWRRVVDSRAAPLVRWQIVEDAD